jgi:multisubunit Na+/H+ antiporter MnhG subunit
MGLDIRLPIGLMFTLLGALLAVWGVIADPAIYDRSLGHNVNLVWGIVLFIFGVLLLFMTRKRKAEQTK